MTINAQRTVKKYQGNGATTSFSYPYQFFAAGDLTVMLYDQTAKALVNPQPVRGGGATYDYVLDGVLDPATGEYLNGSNVIFNNAPLGNHLVVLVTAIPETQNVALIDGAKFPSNAVNTELDRLTAEVQDLYNMLLWALRFSFTDPQPSPFAAGASGVLVLNGDGTFSFLQVTVVQSTAVTQTSITVNADGQIPNNAQTVYVDTSGGPRALTLPAGHQDIRIKDKNGHAGANNITLTPDTGTVDGAANIKIQTNHGALSFAFDGVNWNAF